MKEFTQTTKKGVLAAAMLLMPCVIFAQQGRPAPTVAAGKVATVNEVDTKRYIGKVSAIQDVTIRARVSGYLNKVHFKEGDMVKTGDLLMSIEDTTYVAALKSAEAKMAQIKAELEYASKNYKRQAVLSASKAVSESSLEDSARLLEYTKARHAEAEAAVMDARNNLSYTQIKSPMDGRIGKCFISSGNYVTVNTALADIVRSTPTYVTFSMSEPDFMNMFGSIDAVKKNGVVRVKMANKKLLDEIGSVYLVDNKVDETTGTIKIWAEFENKKQLLVPGSVLEVMISKQVAAKVPAVPLSAVLLSRAGHYVYTLTPDNKAIQVPVQVGEVIGTMQIIKSGLKADQVIVTDGTHKIMMPGMTVTPVFAK